MQSWPGGHGPCLAWPRPSVSSLGHWSHQQWPAGLAQALALTAPTPHSLNSFLAHDATGLSGHEAGRVGRRCALLTGPPCPSWSRAALHISGPSQESAYMPFLTGHSHHSCAAHLCGTPERRPSVPPLLPWAGPSLSSPPTSSKLPPCPGFCTSDRPTMLVSLVGPGWRAHESQGQRRGPSTSQGLSLPHLSAAQLLPLPCRPCSTLSTPGAASPRLPALPGPPHLPVVIPCPSTAVSAVTESQLRLARTRKDLARGDPSGEAWPAASMCLCSGLTGRSLPGHPAASAWRRRRHPHQPGVHLAANSFRSGCWQGMGWDAPRGVGTRLRVRQGLSLSTGRWYHGGSELQMWSSRTELTCWATLLLAEGRAARGERRNPGHTSRVTGPRESLGSPVAPLSLWNPWVCLVLCFNQSEPGSLDSSCASYYSPLGLSPLPPSPLPFSWSILVLPDPLPLCGHLNTPASCPGLPAPWHTLLSQQSCGTDTVSRQCQTC